MPPKRRKPSKPWVEERRVHPGLAKQLKGASQVSGKAKALFPSRGHTARENKEKGEK